MDVCTENISCWKIGFSVVDDSGVHSVCLWENCLQGTVEQRWVRYNAWRILETHPMNAGRQMKVPEQFLGDILSGHREELQDVSSQDFQLANVQRTS